MADSHRAFELIDNPRLAEDIADETDLAVGMELPIARRDAACCFLALRRSSASVRSLSGVRRPAPLAERRRHEQRAARQAAQQRQQQQQPRRRHALAPILGR